MVEINLIGYTYMLVIITNPLNNKTYTFESSVPTSFKKVFKNEK